MGIVGRDAELRWLSAAIDGARAGNAGVRVVAGEPGIGKTALLDEATGAAGEFQVVRVAGIESEMELGHAGLHRVLQPYLGLLEALPNPQAAAMRQVFGMADGRPPERFLVGLATLSLLAHAATSAPLLCVIDDSQWLDAASREALSLAARRLHADRVALLFGARDTPEASRDFDGLPLLRLGSLPPADAAALVHRVVPHRLDRRVADRVVEETGGHPLAIVELANDLTADELAVRSASRVPLPVPKRLEQHFLTQVRRLSPQAQTFLLIAAADPVIELDAITSAAATLGLDEDAPRAARDAGLLVLEPRVMFRHPLVRSAVYSSAPLEDRRRVHAALATSSGLNDGERRAWHLAAAATGPDESIAAVLEEAAELARARGSLATAAAILARAAGLTPDPHRRAERLLTAARYFVLAGAPGRASALLDESERVLEEPFAVARALQLRGLARRAMGDAVDAVSILIHAAQALLPFDVHLARATLLHAVAAARIAGQFANPGAGQCEVAAEARAMPVPAGAEPTAADLLLDGYAALALDGPQIAIPILHGALQRLAVEDSEHEDLLLWLGLGCWVAGAIAADEALAALAAKLVDRARSAGALLELSTGLLYLAMSRLLSGELGAARAHFAERSEIIAALGIDIDVGPAVVQAWAGDATGTRDAVQSIIEFAEQRRQGWMLLWATYALGILELGLGNYEAAFAATTKEYENDSFLVVVGYPNMIEAAVRAGHFDFARNAFDVFCARASLIETPISLAMSARTAALLADDSDAEPLYRHAIALLGASRAELQLARAHLVYGEWLRRRHRSRDAREQLRTAYGMFAAKGVEGYAERARTELAATGERVRRRDVSTAVELTAQERRIAELASEGATNQEIATKLYLSANTVDYHLRKVFRKLDIGSRRQLGAALAGRN